MQDIDFDEIDRAVSSVTNPGTKTAAPAVDTPVFSEATPEASSLTSSVPSPAARRSSGRFMDVVHPSSDMRPEPTRLSAPSAPSFHRDEPALISEPENVEAATNTSTAFHWPDPIDAQPAESVAPAESEVIPEPKPAVVDETPEVIEEPEIPAIPELLEDDDVVQTPLESPFIADAKVEKRPLGAFSDPDPELLTPEDFPSSQIGTSTAQTVTEEPVAEPEMPTNHETPAEIPRELHDDVLLLDGHNNEHEPAVDTPPTPELELIPVGPTSIMQQYKEQPSTATAPSGAIFDTEVYNQALVHTPKSNKSVLIIVWIVALILVGGGIGAGIYFVVLPMLG